MKEINFIKPVPPKKDYEARAWILLVFIITAITLAGIIGQTYLQLWALRHAGKQRLLLEQKAAVLLPLHTKEQALKKEELTLKQELAKIEKKIRTPHVPSRYLTAINKASQNDFALHTLRIAKHIITFSGPCTNAPHAARIAKELNDGPEFKEISITSLQQSVQDGTPLLMASFSGVIEK